jgi:hypothetical protein
MVAAHALAIGADDVRAVDRATGINSASAPTLFMKPESKAPRTENEAR